MKKEEGDSEENDSFEMMEDLQDEILSIDFNKIYSVLRRSLTDNEENRKKNTIDIGDMQG